MVFDWHIDAAASKLPCQAWTKSIFYNHLCILAFFKGFFPTMPLPATVIRQLGCHLCVAMSIMRGEDARRLQKIHVTDSSAPSNSLDSNVTHA